jgi:diguanylate cyclase (GGDEF)-like protein
MTVERIAAEPHVAKPAVKPPHAELPAGLIPPIPENELTANVRAVLAALSSEVENLRRDLQVARERLEEANRAADRDQLLPVLNRRAFLRELTRHIALASRYGTPASLLYFDLNGFKHINDSYGHACGDAMLSHFAEMLCTNVRDSDVVGRLGGDEFAVILAHASAAQAQRKALSLMDALSARPAQWNGTPKPIGFSFGVFELGPGESAETSLARADQAMYEQKRAVRR